MPELLCEVSDRTDIRLKISIALFFSDEKMRQEILIRRNEIKIIIKSIISSKVMGLVKKDTIEPELKKAVNGMFSREVLTDIVLKDIQIEKVTKP